MGLAGFFLVTDAWERFLVKHGILPKPDYNNPADSRDIPLVLADRCFCKPEGGSKVARIHFDPFDHDGYLGSIPVCNGMAFPKLEVKARKYRLRLLNGALARVHLLELWDAGEIAEGANLDELFSDASKDGHPYRIEKAWHRIGKDSWMTERPVKDSSLLLAMADRADVIVDFKALLKGRAKATFFLVNVCDQRNGRGPGHGDNGLADADGAGTTDRPRGDRENVPRLDDVDRQVEFSVNEGGPTWGTLKVLRIDVTADAGADPCSFTGDLSTLKTLLARSTPPCSHSGMTGSTAGPASPWASPRTRCSAPSPASCAARNAPPAPAHEDPRPPPALAGPRRGRLCRGQPHHRR